MKAKLMILDGTHDFDSMVMYIDVPFHHLNESPTWVGIFH